MGENVVKIIGIRISQSKDGQRTYYNYFYTKPFGQYDIDNSEVYGLSCGTEFSGADLGCKVGDEVEFRYAKGFGDKARLVGCTVVKSATSSK